MHSSMSISGIQGQLLEITVLGCNNLKDTEWISRQDPYVVLEYGNTNFRTRTCTDGNKNPIFQEKFVFKLIEGLWELNVAVWNSNTLTYDDFIGSAKVQLQKVLSQGIDDSLWSLQTKTGRYAGEVRLIMYNANANRPATTFAPSAPLYGTPPPVAQYPLYSSPPPTAYPPPSPYVLYPPNPALAAYVSPPQLAAAYPPPQFIGYLPQPYPRQPVPPQSYPPPPQASPYYPPMPGPYPGIYPPPPY